MKWYEVLILGDDISQFCHLIVFGVTYLFAFNQYNHSVTTYFSPELVDFLTVASTIALENEIDL